MTRKMLLKVKARAKPTPALVVFGVAFESSDSSPPPTLSGQRL